MTKSDRVCSEHFLPTEWSAFYETKLPDGTVHRIKRGRAILNPGVTPSIFKDYPSYYQKHKSERKPPTTSATDNVQFQSAPEITPSDDCTTFETPSCDTNHTTTDPEIPCTNEVWDLLKNIQMPLGWIVTRNVENASCLLAHMSSEQVTDKNSYNFTMDKYINFLSNPPNFCEVKIQGVLYPTVTSIVKTEEDVRNLLSLVDSLRVCGGTGNGNKLFSKGCTGALYPKSNFERCAFCHAEKDRLRQKEKRAEKVEERKEKKKKKIASTMKSLRKSKARLILKVNALYI
ncbi:uncharacterized protein LOC127750532 [Frankliniella occidentalis]|uniref:Uncharacterized protein LOC127750532 n=1 Tax=Frankliniella occidentalis TaxID=133901 RepID=A0A9C6XRH9_FRAOC|nr:uncharacterized protein LOC127750532 [Frankliniella occidentalis]